MDRDKAVAALREAGVTLALHDSEPDSALLLELGVVAARWPLSRRPGAYPRCDMYVPTMDDSRPGGERSRYRLERNNDETGYCPAESCSRHLPEMLFDLGNGDDVTITVTLHYDEPEAGE